MDSDSFVTYRSNRQGFASPRAALRTWLDRPGASWVERHVIADDLEAATERIYNEIFEELRGAPVRFWNFIPSINDDAGADGHGDRERYKIFNRARRRAWLAYDPSLATVCAGTAVGSPNDVLSVFAYAAPEPVVHVENPRQTPFLAYSALYGTPPCSRRATRIGDTLWIAGTASIVGEATRAGDTAAQLAETLENIRLVIAATGAPFVVRHARVYVRDPSETVAVGRAVGEALRAETSAMTADICRLPLRLEVECVATL